MGDRDTSWGQHIYAFNFPSAPDEYRHVGLAASSPATPKVYCPPRHLDGIFFLYSADMARGNCAVDNHYYAMISLSLKPH